MSTLLGLPPAVPSASLQAASEARAVRRRLAEAGDDQVLQVVRFVDNLADRGQADALLMPVRERLRVLRPARKVRFTRLLFNPLDPLIVKASAWRADSPMIPRNALTPLSDMVRAGFGDHMRTLEAEIGAVTADDGPAIAHLGAALWPRAAGLIDASPMPPSWLAQGLPASAFLPLQRTVAFVLAMEAPLVELETRVGGEQILEEYLGELLAAAQTRGVPCWGGVLALLLQRFPNTQLPFRTAIAKRTDRAGAQAAEAALGLATGWIETAAAMRGPPDLALAGAEIARQADLLDCLAAEPHLRRQAIDLRAALQAACAARFAAGLQTCIVARLTTAPDAPAFEAIEQAARHLRRMETESRRLGGGPGYERQLRDVGDRIVAAPGLEHFDRVRLIEILLGGSAALRLHRSHKL